MLLLNVFVSNENGVVMVCVMRFMNVCRMMLLMLNCGLLSEFDIGMCMLILLCEFFSRVIVSCMGKLVVFLFFIWLLKVSWLMKIWLLVVSLFWLSR